MRSVRWVCRLRLVAESFVTLCCRVFLTGKVHVEYRKVLNTLFTRKALGYVSGLRLLFSVCLLFLYACLFLLEHGSRHGPATCSIHVHRLLLSSANASSKLQYRGTDAVRAKSEEIDRHTSDAILRDEDASRDRDDATRFADWPWGCLLYIRSCGSVPRCQYCLLGSRSISST